MIKPKYRQLRGRGAHFIRMLILNQKQVKKIVPLSKVEEVINKVERAFLAYAKEKVQMPPKSYLYFKEYDGDLRTMPAFAPELKMASTKIINVHPQNPKKGLPTIMAVIILNDAKTGRPLALLEGAYITGLRTGAAGAVAVKYLARKDARTLGVVGAGTQSLFQIVAICKVRKIKEIFVYDSNPKKIDELAWHLKKLRIKATVHTQGDLKETARQDILVTLTPSRRPIIKKEWIMPGTHINAIGADAPGKEELDPSILKGAGVFVDDWIQASHSGEINVPLRKGIIKKRDVAGSLSEVIVGKKKGRLNDNQITVFDSTGLAIQDLYVAHFVYQKAKKLKRSEILILPEKYGEKRNTN